MIICRLNVQISFHLQHVHWRISNSVKDDVGSFMTNCAEVTTPLLMVCVCVGGGYTGERPAEYETRRESVPVQPPHTETAQSSEGRQGHLRVCNTHTLYVHFTLTDPVMSVFLQSEWLYDLSLWVYICHTVLLSCKLWTQTSCCSLNIYFICLNVQYSGG